MADKLTLDLDLPAMVPDTLRAAAKAYRESEAENDAFDGGGDGKWSLIAKELELAAAAIDEVV